MNIVTSTDRKYLLPTLVMLKSLLIHVEDKVTVYVLHTDLTIHDINKIKKVVEIKYNSKVVFILIQDNDNYPLTLRHTSAATYNRLKISYVLPKEVERILYLDGDIVVNRNLSDFYNCDMRENAAVVCVDYHVQRQYNNKKRLNLESRFDYFNAGVLLLDMNLIRKIITDEAINLIIKKYKSRLYYQDQDILNILLNRQIRFAKAKKFNYMPVVDKLYPKEIIEPYIIHYAGDVTAKPWNVKSIGSPYFKIYWKYGKTIFGFWHYVAVMAGNCVYRLLHKGNL